MYHFEDCLSPEERSKARQWKLHNIPRNMRKQVEDKIRACLGIVEEPLLDFKRQFKNFVFLQRNPRNDTLTRIVKIMLTHAVADINEGGVLNEFIQSRIDDNLIKENERSYAVRLTVFVRFEDG